MQNFGQDMQTFNHDMQKQDTRLTQGKDLWIYNEWNNSNIQ